MMIIAEILVLLLIVPFFLYRIINTYQKRTLTEWLYALSGKYGIKPHDIVYFHLKLTAIDNQRGVVILLDNMDGEKNGHIVGLQEITGCELFIHETNKDANSHNVDRIDLQLTLNEQNRVVIFPLYEKTFFSSLNRKKLQVKALNFYEELSAIVQKTETSVSLIA